MNICKGWCSRYVFRRKKGNAFIYYNGKVKYCRACEIFLDLSSSSNNNNNNNDNNNHEYKQNALRCICCNGKLRYAPAHSYFRRGYQPRSNKN